MLSFEISGSSTSFSLVVNLFVDLNSHLLDPPAAGGLDTFQRDILTVH